ncbi:MAG TPA: SRPBCC domain-containing protein [Candidatus Limnocylindrales bacterium]|nr:SRPBCC domain-containing protein [Candidatus Limnocylindrales bacterium]
MPTSYTVARRIEAQPERVWSLLTNAAGYGTWNKAVLSIDGQIAPGSTITLVSIANPKRAFKLMVTAMTPPNLMIWADAMPLGLFRGVRTFHVDAREGVTHFEMTEVYSGVLAPIFTKAIPDLTESFNVFADSLKSAAEAAV